MEVKYQIYYFFRLSQTARDELFKSNNLNPGPGNYEIEENLSKKKGKSFKFSKDEKLKNVKSFTPGPGTYKVPCSISNVPVYTVGKFAENFKFV